MKKVLLPLFLSVFIFISFYSDAQNKVSASSPAKGNELILYMPYVDKMKTLQTVIDMVKIDKEIKPVAFCDDLKCLLIRIEGNHPEKAERILQDLKGAGINFTVKEQATIQQVLNQSKNILTEETYWQ
jgi:hypothetical protein